MQFVADAAVAIVAAPWASDRFGVGVDPANDGFMVADPVLDRAREEMLRRVTCLW